MSKVDNTELVGPVKSVSPEHSKLWWELQDIKDSNHGFFRSPADQHNFFSQGHIIFSKKARTQLQQELNVKIPTGEVYKYITFVFSGVAQGEAGRPFMKKWGFFAVIDNAGLYKLYRLYYKINKTELQIPQKQSRLDAGALVIDSDRTKLIWKRTMEIPAFLKGIVMAPPKLHDNPKLALNTTINREAMTIAQITPQYIVFKDNGGTLFAIQKGPITDRVDPIVGNKHLISGVVKKLINIGPEYAGLLFKPIIYSDSAHSEYYRSRTSGPY